MRRWIVITGLLLSIAIPAEASLSQQGVDPASRLLLAQVEADEPFYEHIETAQWMALRRALRHSILFPNGLTEGDVPIGPSWLRVRSAE